MNKETITTPEGVDAWFKGKKGVIAFDTETTSLKYTQLELLGVSLCDGRDACYINVYKSTRLDEILSAILRGFAEFHTIIGHNIVYDLKVLYKYGIDLRDKKLFDTMVAHHLLNENERHGLKHLAKTKLGEEVLEFEVASKFGYNHPVFIEYAINDAVWTWKLSTLFNAELKQDKGLAQLFRQIEMPFQLVLFEMETNGMLIDMDRVLELRKQLEEDRNNMLMLMCNKLGVRYSLQTNLMDGSLNVITTVNFDSPVQLRTILFEKYGLKPIEKTETGSDGVGKLTLQHYKDHEFVTILYKYKIIQKALVAYLGEDAQITSNLELDGRVRTSFRDTGTKTGRLSSSDPNIQQLSKPNKVYPIPIREVFIATPGYKMITLDYSGQEVCVAAQISKDPTLIDALQSGKDIHLAVANQFYELGIPEEELFGTHPNFKVQKEKHDKIRTQAKMITFGLMYGKGKFGFSQDFGVSEDEAQDMIDRYFEGMPNIKQAIEDAHNSVKERGEVTYMSGRKRRFEKTKRDEWTGYTKKDLRQAFNALVQGYSADMIRIACNNIITKRSNYPQWGLRMLATVHDEVVLEIKEEYVEEAVPLLKQWMEEPFSWMDVPIKSDVGIGDNYAQAK